MGILAKINDLDAFSNSIALKRIDGDPRDSTVFGGLRAMTIYFLTAIYFLYLFALWITCELKPTVTYANIIDINNSL
jgi:hypothetical protein